MKVIFLDIDGVMNSELYARKQYAKRWLRLETYKWWIVAKVKFVLNGFRNKPISLLNYKLPKDFHSFKNQFKHLKEQTDPMAWRFLVSLINDTGAKICVSSVWKRNFETISDWNKAFHLMGLPTDVCVGITGVRRTMRGSEIKEWLDANPMYDKYAIIDDDSDMLSEQMSSFFRTDGYCGLSPNVCYQIKNHFNK